MQTFSEGRKFKNKKILIKIHIKNGETKSWKSRQDFKICSGPAAILLAVGDGLLGIVVRTFGRHGYSRFMVPSIALDRSEARAVISRRYALSRSRFGPKLRQHGRAEHAHPEVTPSALEADEQTSGAYPQEPVATPSSFHFFYYTGI
jgi:hypothetical protein